MIGQLDQFLLLNMVYAYHIHQLEFKVKEKVATKKQLPKCMIMQQMDWYAVLSLKRKIMPWYSIFFKKNL